MAKDQSLRSVSLFTVAYLLVAAIATLQTGNLEFAYYIVVVLLLGLLVLAVHTRVKLSPGVLWGLSLWGLLHMIGGLMPVPAGWPFAGDKGVFYSLWLIPDILKFDQLIHAYGFGVATVLCWEGIRTLLKKPEPTAGVLLLCAIGGMGLGAANEIVEFIAVLLIPSTNVGGYENTGWDLVANAVGAAIAALLIKITGKPRRSRWLPFMNR